MRTLNPHESWIGCAVEESTADSQSGICRWRNETDRKVTVSLSDGETVERLSQIRHALAR